MSEEERDLDREVAELIKLHGPDAKCVLMGTMGETDVMAAHEILDYAEEHYDRFDYAELHACTLDVWNSYEYEVTMGESP